MNTKKMICLALGILSFAWLAPGYGWTGVCRADSLERDLERMAAETNEHLPLQMDRQTRLDRVEAGPGKNCSCIYTVSDNLTDSQRRQVQDSVTRQTLAAPVMRPILRAGVTVWFKYFDAAGNKVQEFSVKDTNASVQETGHNSAYKTAYRWGYAVGAILGALLAGVFCGLPPLFFGIIRGRALLACTALVGCAVAGLLLGLLLAVPVAVGFSAVIFATPRAAAAA